MPGLFVVRLAVFLHPARLFIWFCRTDFSEAHIIWNAEAKFILGMDNVLGDFWWSVSKRSWRWSRFDSLVLSFCLCVVEQALEKRMEKRQQQGADYDFRMNE